MPEIAMVLKMQTDYALRTLIYLAHLNEQVPVETIADAYKISKDHLVKVVQQLVRLGYVASKAGRHGGVRLAKDPATINCAAVVGDFEGRNGLLPCVNDIAYCVLEPGCKLRLGLISAENAMYQVLEKLTVADMVRAPTDGTKAGGIYNLTVHGAPARPIAPATPPPDTAGASSSAN
ncbi:MAG TPA: Rrf2 family transcriptional regulator [Tepidisphaeraceae bacterium]